MLDYFTSAHVSALAVEHQSEQMEYRSFKLYQGLRRFGPASSLVSWLTTRFHRHVQKRRARETAQILMKLSVRQLQDIGVVRAEIPYLANASTLNPGLSARDLRDDESRNEVAEITTSSSNQSKEPVSNPTPVRMLSKLQKRPRKDRSLIVRRSPPLREHTISTISRDLNERVCCR